MEWRSSTGQTRKDQPRAAHLLLSVLLLIALMPICRAQEMHAMAAQPSDHLDLHGLDGSTFHITPAELKAMPHKTISVFNAHIKKQESYSGVPLTDLLLKVHAPVGTALKGKLFATGVLAEGTDGYTVLYSIAEVDPVMHTGDVIVADTVNGQPLTTTGAFQLINTEDKRPARWVHNLDSITVIPVDTK
jgi:hypothetical protein